MSDRSVAKTVKLQSRLSRNYEVFLISIPKEIIKALGWEKGDTLLIKVIKFEDKDAIVIYKP